MKGILLFLAIMGFVIGEALAQRVYLMPSGKFYVIFPDNSTLETTNRAMAEELSKDLQLENFVNQDFQKYYPVYNDIQNGNYNTVQ